MKRFLVKHQNILWLVALIPLATVIHLILKHFVDAKVIVCIQLPLIFIQILAFVGVMFSIKFENEQYNTEYKSYENN